MCFVLVTLYKTLLIYDKARGVQSPIYQPKVYKPRKPAVWPKSNSRCGEESIFTEISVNVICHGQKYKFSILILAGVRIFIVKICIESDQNYFIRWKNIPTFFIGQCQVFCIKIYDHLWCMIDTRCYFSLFFCNKTIKTPGDIVVRLTFFSILICELFYFAFSERWYEN